SSIRRRTRSTGIRPSTTSRRGRSTYEWSGGERAMSTGAPAATARFEEVLALGDDALIAAQRLSHWAARAPDMEEDVALMNIALDQLGAARLLLTYAGELPGARQLALPGVPDGTEPLTEDQLAYLREDRQFRNALLVELPNGDFAMTMGKLLFLA